MLHVDEMIRLEDQKHALRCQTIRNDYEAGCRDCKNGVYDKFYRYNRLDDGQAYDSGWYYTNQTMQVEKVNFI